MSLELTINEQLKLAMKAGEKLRVETLRSIRASIIEFNKSGAEAPMDAEGEIKLLNTAAKKRRDAIEMYLKAERQELADKETAELEIIQEFLPKQLTDEELGDVVKGIIAKVGAEGMQHMGKVMGMSMKELSGKADGNKVQTIVKDILGSM